MLYRPRLSSGKFISLSWPLAAYRLNNSAWPLRDNASLLEWLFERFCWMLTSFIFLQHNDAEMRYLIANKHNLDEMLSGMPMYLILLEVHTRVFHRGLNKEGFKRFLQKFYAEIYIEEPSHPELYADIQQRLRPIWFCSALYVTAVSTYFVPLLKNNFNNVREPVFKMTYPFDITPLPIYVAIVLSNIWAGMIVTTMLNGENNLRSEVMLHLNGRFLLLQKKLQENTERLLHEADGKNIAAEFSRHIIEAIRENVRLYKFGEDFQRTLSFDIFINLSFSALLLCVSKFLYKHQLSARVFTGAHTYSYIKMICL